MLVDSSKVLRPLHSISTLRLSACKALAKAFKDIFEHRKEGSPCNATSLFPHLNRII